MMSNEVYARADEIDRLCAEQIKAPSGENRRRLEELLREIMPFVEADCDAENLNLRGKARNLAEIIRFMLDGAGED